MDKMRHGAHDFERMLQKSKYLHQYRCSKCDRYWWGPDQKNTCFECNKVAQALTLDAMIGIGWFQCQCGRRYAGFSRGNVTSKCHGCQVENLPMFIQPGDKASEKDKSDKKHFCSACNGSYGCPVVAEAKAKRHKPQTLVKRRVR